MEKKWYVMSKLVTKSTHLAKINKNRTIIMVKNSNNESAKNNKIIIISINLQKNGFKYKS